MAAQRRYPQETDFGGNISHRFITEKNGLLASYGHQMHIRPHPALLQPLKIGGGLQLFFLVLNKILLFLYELDINTTKVLVTIPQGI